MSRTLVHSLLVLVSSLICYSAFAHDAPIRQGGYKNLAGEWCCGAGDCFAIDAKEIQASPVGYKLPNGEIVPFAEVQPSMDGTYWRCMRPDGSRRCFFAPPSGS